jgi:hypothetical protein
MMIIKTVDLHKAIIILSFTLFKKKLKKKKIKMKMKMLKTIKIKR